MSEKEKQQRRRIAIELPLVKEIRLYLWAKARGLSKTEMVERIVIDRVSNADNWAEVIRDLRQDAAIQRKDLKEYVADLLRDEFDFLAVDEIDWSPLLEVEEQFDEQAE